MSRSDSTIEAFPEPRLFFCRPGPNKTVQVCIQQKDGDDLLIFTISRKTSRRVGVGLVVEGDKD